MSIRAFFGLSGSFCERSSRPPGRPVPLARRFLSAVFHMSGALACGLGRLVHHLLGALLGLLGRLLGGALGSLGSLLYITLGAFVGLAKGISANDCAEQDCDEYFG